MSRVRVNVVVRTFNEEDWIKHCLKEILNQTFSDFVITVVDSGSLDATVNVVQWVADRNPGKVKILHLDKFFPGDAINRGVHAVDSGTSFVSQHTVFRIMPTGLQLWFSSWTKHRARQERMDVKLH